MSTSHSLVQKLWNYCNVLRDDGMSYADYVEQLTFMLFLKMAEERSKPPFLDLAPISEDINWQGLMDKDNEHQLAHYQIILNKLGMRTDLFGSIFRNALSKFRDPAKFQMIAKEIDLIEWSQFDSDVKGDAYEGLLEKTASDGKAGAGQYFTARPLVDAIASVMILSPEDSVCDPAAGTGGFLLAALREMRQKLSTDKEAPILEASIHAVELVESVARLCLMNLVLHGMGGEMSPVDVADALETMPSRRFDVVMTNPPFGRKSSVTIINSTGGLSKESLTISRNDFWATTSNKQLNFIQHIFTILKENGRAAVVVPDNVLFEGGAGEIIRRKLLRLTNVHTLLRLPTGIFYAQGVKANVLFFDRKPSKDEQVLTEVLWIYDLRTNQHFTLKEHPIKRRDLEDFITCYQAANRDKRIESERFKAFSYEELITRDKLNLDIFWLKDNSLEDSDNLPDPSIIAQDIIEDLQSALEHFSEIQQ